MKLILQRSPDGILMAANVVEQGMPIGTAVCNTIETAVTKAIERVGEDVGATPRELAENISIVEAAGPASDEEAAWAVIDGIREP